MRALSKEDLKLSRENMRGAASLWKERQTLSLPPTCTQLVLCEKGKFSLDGSFSKNAPYKQKIIFHLTSIGKMSRKFFFLPWTVGRWYTFLKFLFKGDPIRKLGPNSSSACYKLSFELSTTSLRLVSRLHERDASFAK